LQNKRDAGAGCVDFDAAFHFREIMSLLSDCSLHVERHSGKPQRIFEVGGLVD